MQCATTKSICDLKFSIFESSNTQFNCSCKEKWHPVFLNMNRPSVKIVQLGLMRYQEALNLQHMYARKHLDFLAGKTKEQGNLVEIVNCFVSLNVKVMASYKVLPGPHGCSFCTKSRGGGRFTNLKSSNTEISVFWHFCPILCFPNPAICKKRPIKKCLI